MVHDQADQRIDGGSECIDEARIVVCDVEQELERLGHGGILHRWCGSLPSPTLSERFGMTSNVPNDAVGKIVFI